MLAIINAHILTITQGEIDNGTILIESGKIVQVGADVVVPEDIDVLDVQGAYVLPGLIDAHRRRACGGKVTTVMRTRVVQ